MSNLIDTMIDTMERRTQAERRAQAEYARIERAADDLRDRAYRAGDSEAARLAGDGQHPRLAAAARSTVAIRRATADHAHALTMTAAARAMRDAFVAAGSAPWLVAAAHGCLGDAETRAARALGRCHAAHKAANEL